MTRPALPLSALLALPLATVPFAQTPAGPAGVAPKMWTIDPYPTTDPSAPIQVNTVGDVWEAWDATTAVEGTDWELWVTDDTGAGHPNDEPESWWTWAQAGRYASHAVENHPLFLPGTEVSSTDNNGDPVVGVVVTGSRIPDHLRLAPVRVTNRIEVPQRESGTLTVVLALAAGFAIGFLAGLVAGRSGRG